MPTCIVNAAHKVKRPWQGWKCLLTATTTVERKKTRAEKWEPCMSCLLFFFLSMFVTSFIHIHSPTLSLFVFVTEPISPMNYFIRMCMQQWSVRRNTSPYEWVYVWMFYSVIFWFVYQYNDWCSFKVHNDVHTCIQNIIIFDIVNRDA